MKVCPNCFSDLELSSFLRNERETIGNCEGCQSTTMPLTHLDELRDFFQELVDCFVRVEHAQEFRSTVQGKWGLFSSLSVADRVLNHILPQLSTEITHASTGVDFDPEILENVGYWAILKDKLKWSNRYLTEWNKLTQDLGWDGFLGVQKSITSEDRLYRARIHHESGKRAYSVEEMMAPQKELAKGGRANPMGIPFLYLTDSVETTLYEVRSAYLDEVSVGTFTINSNVDRITVVDFTEEPILYTPGAVNKTIKARLLKDLISQELSKPMRRYDSEIEYIPTQFICEFIRVVTGASGIRFSSSLRPEGKNVVIFDQSKVKCMRVDVHKVTRLTLSSMIIS